MVKNSFMTHQPKKAIICHKQSIKSMLAFDTMRIIIIIILIIINGRTIGPAIDRALTAKINGHTRAIG